MRQITFNEVVSSWLKDEWHYDIYSDLRKDRKIRNLVLNPDLSCEDDNKERLRILSRDRKSIINKIPNDTVWYVTPLNSKLMSNLYLIHTNWCKSITHKTYKLRDIDYKELKKVDPVHLRRIIAIRKSKKVQDSRMIFFGSDIKKPLTVIEGNHRAIANHLSFQDKKVLINSSVYVGVSESAMKTKLSYEYYTNR